MIRATVKITLTYTIDAETSGDAVERVLEGFENADVYIDGAECQNVNFKLVKIED